jgi:hypothetical protein
MLTLEIHGQYITWPDEFAVLMMKYYRDNGVSFIVHRNCVHCGCRSAGANSLMAELAESSDARKYNFCCCPQLAGS